MFKFLMRRDPNEEYMALKSKLQALIERGEDESPQGEGYERVWTSYGLKFQK
jgi:hypothetical protein